MIKKTKRLRSRKHNQQKRKSRKKRHSKILANFRRIRAHSRNKKKASREQIKRNASLLKAQNISNPGYGKIYVKITRKNLHLGLTKVKKITKKPKIKNKLSRRTRFDLVAKKSIGQLPMYKGRAKSSPIARKALVKTFMKETAKHNVHQADMILLSEVGKHHFGLLSAFAQKNFIIRMVLRKVSRPHGYVRRKKARRI
jgi:ribosomal protein S11